MNKVDNNENKVKGVSNDLSKNEKTKQEREACTEIFKETIKQIAVRGLYNSF